MSDDHPKSLNIPPQAKDADVDKTFEMARIWWIDGNPAGVIAPAFEDPAGWGVLLHTIAEFAAEAYVGTGKTASQEETLRAIEDKFSETIKTNRKARAKA